MDDYKADIDSLEKEIQRMEEEYDKLQTSVSAKRAATRVDHVSESSDKQRTLDGKSETSNSKRRKLDEEQFLEDELIPDPARHEFFDGLVNDIIERATRDSDKTSEVRKAKKLAIYDKLKQDLLPKINTENVYRMAGITAFPVNDPFRHGEYENAVESYLGIRFDIYDQRSRKYVTPHYLILQRVRKNNEWEVFKTTLPKFIPVRSLELKWLNTDIQRFVVQIRSHLVFQQLKSEVFSAIRDHLDSTSRMEYDLNYTKVKLTLKKKVAVVLICNLTEVINVITTDLSAMTFASGVASVLSDELKTISSRLEVMLKGKISGLEERFLVVLAEIGL
ncbi:unnamed protein product [Kuraishia capsulata CBS 1993]|uniref:Central kinetochore subunit MCM21 n=1 Tax=Kuraishia capsulata CBS 1993 TaxID=1382522 RepID=W6MGD3_9ASCO|nr:uncharacterized protein KUCA_T00001096001 [Kuraishia capsulata CBS 1993]CDK25129.1 unnamed protein product [Kuraishia capsulata CBS 1993]